MWNGQVIRLQNDINFSETPYAFSENPMYFYHFSALKNATYVTFKLLI